MCCLTNLFCLFIHDLLIERVVVLKTFSQQIKHELLESQQKALSLQELSAQLLVTMKPCTQLLQTQRSEQIWAQGSECLEAQEKVHVIMNRLTVLLREVNSDLQNLEKRLEAVDKQQVRKRIRLNSPAFIYLLLKLNENFLVFCRSAYCLKANQKCVPQLVRCQMWLDKVAHNW